MLTEWQVGWMAAQEDAGLLVFDLSTEVCRGWIEARQDVWDAWGVEERLATSESSLLRLS